MLHPNALVKTPECWKFVNEVDLEDFVWKNLEILFGLEPLKRQYTVQGERCDILGLLKSRQLVIIELKNVEGRYVVQQLTRYCHNLLKEKPLADLIDYTQPIKLIAIAPSFHRHNYIDKFYINLPIIFLKFEINQMNKELMFYLKDLEDKIVASQKLEYPDSYVTDETNHLSLPDIKVVPRISRLFEKMLIERHPKEKELALQIRDKIMSFDERIAEVSTSVVTRYGLKKCNGEIPITRMVGEFYSYSFKGEWLHLCFSLWLPVPSTRRTSGTYKKKIEKVLVNMIYPDKAPTLAILKNPNPLAINTYDYLYSPNQYLKLYKSITGKSMDSCSLNNLIEVALSEWQQRINT
ncbi:hypothetical protein NIES2101_09290 [Calothrix sp. HK-06]|nr:hypothetical protein NIES2101_09290 [Calothrix sp. HK-06]